MNDECDYWSCFIMNLTDVDKVTSGRRRDENDLKNCRLLRNWRSLNRFFIRTLYSSDLAPLDLWLFSTTQNDLTAWKQKMCCIPGELLITFSLFNCFTWSSKSPIALTRKNLIIIIICLIIKLVIFSIQHKRKNKLVFYLL